MGPCFSSSKQNSNVPRLPSVLANLNLKCKVPNCPEDHKFHYCKNCENEDSTHFMRNCPFPPKQPSRQSILSGQPIPPGQQVPSQTVISPAPTQNVKKKCKVVDCSEDHAQHICKFGPHIDSDHWAKDCPDTVELFHSTLLENLQIDNGIAEIGLKPSTKGRLGPGIYLTELKFAEEIKLHLENRDKKPAVVLRCKVKLGNCKDSKNVDDLNGSWVKSYDSCTGTHPQWFNGATSGPFQEWVLKEKKMCRVYDVIISKVAIRMEEYKKIKEFMKTLSTLFQGQISNDEIAKILITKFLQ